MVISEEISPTNPITNFARTTGFNVNGQAKTISRSTDTISITTYIGNNATMKDTIGIKITASTTILGAGTQSGFNNIVFILDNNPTNQVFYTERTMVGGGMKADAWMNNLNIWTRDAQNFTYPFNVYQNAGVNIGLSTRVTPGGTQLVVNQNLPLASILPLSGAAITAYLSGGVGFGTNGSVVATGTANQLASF